MTCSSSWCSRRVKFARSLPSLLMGEGQGEGEKVPTIALTQCNLVIRQLRGVLGFGHLGFERPAAQASAASIISGSIICQTIPLLVKYALTKTATPRTTAFAAPTRPAAQPHRQRATAATLQNAMNSGLVVSHTSPE